MDYERFAGNNTLAIDHDSFLRVYKTYAPIVYGIALRNTGSALAETVLEQVFVSLYADGGPEVSKASIVRLTLGHIKSLMKQTV